MSISELSNKIAGGLTLRGETLFFGGSNRVYGEMGKWSIRNKFLQLKHNNVDVLKILNLHIPVTFGDEYEKTIPKLSKKEIKDITNEKTLIVLKKRLTLPLVELIDKLVDEYNLKEARCTGLWGSY